VRIGTVSRRRRVSSDTLSKLVGMRYDIHVAPHHGSDRTRFEHQQEEPLRVGTLFSTLDMTYEVVRVRPGRDGFDRVLEAEWRAGPATAQYG